MKKRPLAYVKRALVYYGFISVACWSLAHEVGSPERIAISRSYQETMTTLLTISVCMYAPVFCSLLPLQPPNDRL